MRKILVPALLIFSAFTLFTSCQKEVSGEGILPEESENPLLGTWKLIDNDVKTELTQELSDDIGTITNVATLDYVTTNNKGSLTFEEERVLSKQLSFDIVGNIKSDIYVNGFFVETYDTPVNTSVPPSSSSNAYVLIGTDSIYCPDGSFFQLEGAEGIEAGPTGFKFTVQDNRLVLTNHMSEAEEVIEEGVTTTSEINVTVVTTLEKQ